MQREGSSSEPWVAVPFGSAPNPMCHHFNFSFSSAYVRLLYHVSFFKDFKRQSLLGQEQLTEPETRVYCLVEDRVSPKILGLERNFLGKALLLPPFFHFFTVGAWGSVGLWRTKRSRVCCGQDLWFYLRAFNCLPSCPKLAAASSRLAADISKLEMDKAVNVLASFSVAVEWPCPSSAYKASTVTELCLSHAHSSEVASHLPLGFTWESAIANPHTFWRWHTLVHCFPALRLVIIWYVRSFEGPVPAMLAAVQQSINKLCKPSCCEHCPTVFVLPCLPALLATVSKIRIRPHTDVIYCKSSDINFMDNVHMQGCWWSSLWACVTAPALPEAMVGMWFLEGKNHLCLSMRHVFGVKVLLIWQDICQELLENRNVWA